MNIIKRTERKIEMNIIEKMIAVFIERSCKNYVTTIIGVLSVIVFSVNTFGSLIPVDWYTVVNTATVILAGVALILAKDSGKPTAGIPVVKTLGMLLYLLLLPVTVQAQTTTTSTSTATTATFTGGSDVIALRYAGTWGTGNLTTESFDLLDFGKTKTEHLFVEGKELIGAQSGINAYTGGIKFQPDLSKLLAKTNVPADTFGIYFSASGGGGTFSTGGAHAAYMVGGGIEYRSSSTLSWNPLQVQYVRIGNQNAAVISTGLSFLFGQK